jgi:deferrochelatase/peroxidase EfeB
MSVSAGLLAAEDAPEKKDLGRNGSYLVMRQLKQDVREFWKFLYKQAGGNLAEAAQLGAKMVGRTQAGDPSVPIQTEPIAGTNPRTVPQNQFTLLSRWRFRRRKNLILLETHLSSASATETKERATAAGRSSWQRALPF